MKNDLTCTILSELQERFSTLPSQCSNIQPLFDSAGREYIVKYVTLPTSLDGKKGAIASNLPSFRVNKDYLSEFQARDLSAIGESTKIRKIARKLDPTRLLVASGDPTIGTPIVWESPEGKNYVLAGNGRTIAFLLAPNDRYQEYVKEASQRWFNVYSEEKKSGYRSLLVRSVYHTDGSPLSIEDAVKLAGASQESTAGKETPLRQALSRARGYGITKNSTIKPIEKIYPLSIRTVIKFIRDNPGFWNSIVSLAPDYLQGQLKNLDNTTYPIALDYITSILVGMYLPHKIIQEGFGNDKEEDAVIGLLPALASLQEKVKSGAIFKDFALTPLLGVARTFVRENRTKSYSKALEDYTRDCKLQLDMFGGETRPPICKLSKLGVSFGVYLKRMTQACDPTKGVKDIGDYIEDAENYTQSQRKLKADWDDGVGWLEPESEDQREERAVSMFTKYALPTTLAEAVRVANPETFEYMGDKYPLDSPYAVIMSRYSVSPIGEFGEYNKDNWNLYRDFMLSKKMNLSDAKFFFGSSEIDHPSRLGRQVRSKSDLKKLYDMQFSFKKRRAKPTPESDLQVYKNLGVTIPLNILYSATMLDGNIFQVLDRPVGGKEDKVYMRMVTPSGSTIENIGTHSNLKGAKQYAEVFIDPNPKENIGLSNTDIVIVSSLLARFESLKKTKQIDPKSYARKAKSMWENTLPGFLQIKQKESPVEGFVSFVVWPNSLTWEKASKAGKFGVIDHDIKRDVYNLATADTTLQIVPFNDTVEAKKILSELDKESLSIREKGIVKAKGKKGVVKAKPRAIDEDNPTIRIGENFPICQYGRFIMDVSDYVHNKSTRNISKCGDGTFRFEQTSFLTLNNDLMKDFDKTFKTSYRERPSFLGLFTGTYSANLLKFQEGKILKLLPNDAKYTDALNQTYLRALGYGICRTGTKSGVSNSGAYLAWIEESKERAVEGYGTPELRTEYLVPFPSVAQMKTHAEELVTIGLRSIEKRDINLYARSIFYNTSNMSIPAQSRFSMQKFDDGSIGYIYWFSFLMHFNAIICFYNDEFKILLYPELRNLSWISDTDSFSEQDIKVVQDALSLCKNIGEQYSKAEKEREKKEEKKKAKPKKKAQPKTITLYFDQPKQVKASAIGKKFGIIKANRLKPYVLIYLPTGREIKTAKAGGGSQDMAFFKLATARNVVKILDKDFEPPVEFEKGYVIDSKKDKEFVQMMEDIVKEKTGYAIMKQHYAKLDKSMKR